MEFDSTIVIELQEHLQSGAFSFSTKVRFKKWIEYNDGDVTVENSGGELPVYCLIEPVQIFFWFNVSTVSGGELSGYFI